MRVKFIKVAITILAAVLIVPMLGVFIFSARPTSAQGTNLLQDPSFSGGAWYTKAGVDGQIPPGWDIWSSAQLNPVSDFNQFLPHARSAPSSWVIRTGSVLLTGGGFYPVAVTPGTVYRFTIYVFVHSCNDPQFSCIGPDGRKSDRTLGSRVKIGVDPTGGTNATAATVFWTAPQEAYDAFFSITLDVTATAGQLTLFTYSTLSTPAWLNEAYWDDASFVALAAGDGNPINGGSVPAGATAVPPVPQTVPFVSAQQAQADGSVVHTVSEGDTFDSIYVAYRHLGIDRASILALNGWEEPPRWILVGEKIKILPPGSVDPATGRLLRAPGSATPVAAAPTPGAGTAAPTSSVPTPTGDTGDITKGG